MILLAVAAFPSSAAGAPVLFLGHDGRVTARNDPYVTGPAITPAPVGERAPRARAAARASKGSGPTVFSELARLRRTGAIEPATYRSATAGYRAALAEERHLSGTRRTELTAVTETLHDLAAHRQLTASRLPALMATLDANRQWWADGTLLSYGQRVEIAGSQIVWEYYPGQGIQIQVLGSFSKADALYTAGPASYPEMQDVLAQLIPLAARRAGGLAWEYYFSFDGGRPPWTSAMSQGTALEALTRAYQATGDPMYLNVATRALPLFSKGPTSGVSVNTRAGSRYLQYTFAPRLSIINAFLQSLIGLYDFAKASGNPTAKRLFARGNAEAKREVPRFDTGAWSLYQPGVEDSLDYHELVTGFLQELCDRLGARVYCRTAQRFDADLKTPPVLQQLTRTVRSGHAFDLRFRLSKASHVGIVVQRGSDTVLSTSASFSHGVHSFSVPAIHAAGDYMLTLTGTDLAGNFARVTGTLTVRR